MSVKVILVLCAQALLIQSAFSQCGCGGNYGAGISGYGLGAPALAAPLAGNGLGCGAGLGNGAGLGYGAGLGNGIGLGYSSGLGYGASSGYGAGSGYGGLAIEVIPTSGGALPVSSASVLAPSGLSVSSENVYEGSLSVAGELPFVSAVALEGVLPSAGAGAVSYSCGNGVTAAESIGSSAVAYGSAIGAYAPGISADTPAGASISSGLGYGGLASRGCGCGLY